MGKSKLTVARFIRVMSGGAVVMDVDASASQAKAVEAIQLIKGLKAALAKVSVSSDAIDDLITQCDNDLNDALQQPSKNEQGRLFVALVDTARQALNTAQGIHDPLLVQAKACFDLDKGITQQLRGLKDRVGLVGDASLQGLLAVRLKRLTDAQAGLDVGAGTVESAVLAQRVRSFEALQARIDEEDINGYVVAFVQLAPWLKEIDDAINSGADAVEALDDASNLRDLLDDQLSTFAIRLAALKNPMGSLYELMARAQDARDLKTDLSRFEIDKARQLLKQYQDETLALDALIQGKARDVAATPGVLLQAWLNAELASMAGKVVLAPQITSMADLSAKLVLMQGLPAELSDLDCAGILQSAKAYQAALTEASDVHAQSVAAVAAHAPDPLLASLRDALDALLGKAVPMDRIGTGYELSSKSSELKKIIQNLKSLDIDQYLAAATAYRKLVDDVQSALHARRQEAALMVLPSARTMLENHLDAQEAKVLSLDRISLDDLDKQTKLLQSNLSALEALDTLQYQPLLDEHARLTAALPQAIQAKLAQFATDLNAAEQVRMHAGFMDEFNKLTPPASINEVKSQVAALQALTDRVNKQKVAAPRADQKKRFDLIQKDLTDARQLVSGLPTPALQAAATEALDYVQDMLGEMTTNAKLSVRKPPGSLAADISVAHDLEGGYSKVKVKDSEFGRAFVMTTKAIAEALKDPSSLEAQLMEIDGGKRFALGLARMNTYKTVMGTPHRELTPAEALAIHRYTGEDYAGMNRQRRGIEQNDRLAFLNKVCDQALAKMPPYPDVAWPVFRAESAWSQDVVDKRYAKGRQFECGVLWSTGARSVVDFSRGGPKMTHTIYGKAGRDVAGLSPNSHEGAGETGEAVRPQAGRGEVLFPASCVFLVAGRQDPEGGPEAIKYVSPPASNHNRILTTLKEVING